MELTPEPNARISSKRDIWPSDEEIDAIVARDPFVLENLVEARVIAWSPNRRVAGLPEAWCVDAAVSTPT